MDTAVDAESENIMPLWTLSVDKGIQIQNLHTNFSYEYC